MLEESGYELPVEFFVGKTSEIIEAADCCLMVSGSVSLEILARRTPSAVMFRIDWLETVIKWLLVRVKYISLPNLIADRMVLPEWIISGAPDNAVRQITSTLDNWLSHPHQLAIAHADLDNLCDTAIQTGANARAADAIMEVLEAKEQRRAA
jgi:lipid-A-disaccharide synthase